MKMLLMGLMVGAFGMMVVMSYHVVRTTEGVIMISRVHQPPFRSAYLDVRTWDLDKSRAYPEFVEAVVKSGQTELLVQGTAAGAMSGVNDVLEELNPGNVSENARNAMKALVPINFTNAEGETIEQVTVPDPVLPSSADGSQLGDPATFPQRATAPVRILDSASHTPSPAYETQSDSEPAQRSLDQILGALGMASSVAPRSVVEKNFSQALPTELAKSMSEAVRQPDVSTFPTTPQTAVQQPIQDIVRTEVEKAVSDTLIQPQQQLSSKEWIDGLVRSLVTPESDTAVPRIVPQQSLAYPKVEVEAPVPGANTIFPNIFEFPDNAPSASQTEFLPNVRAF
ncbi:MAG: hypothetical protein KDA80_19895 [Planctomycetaceae bacterium]|nr:hypothetical protein [Planctomycetaceae bacterium]